MKLTLASTSPYRRALLARIVADFACVDPAVDEADAAFAALSPRERALELARRKALSGASLLPGTLALGSDQVCALDAQVFHKPGDAATAAAQLQRLAGRTHSLWTAVAFARSDSEACPPPLLVESRLTMRPLSASEIERYVALDQPFDCAGAYRIEDRGIGLFQRIESSDWNAIIGLPLIATREALLVAGVRLD